MADSKISALAAITSLGGTEEFVVAFSGASEKITAANIAKFMPGYEIGYDQITAPVIISSTTEATGTTIIAGSAHTFDGAPVMCEFFSGAVSLPTTTNGFVVISLFEAATQIGELAFLRVGDTAFAAFLAVCGRLRFTPTAASHTYTITAFANTTTGTPSVGAGVGGTATNVPAFCRFTKV